LAYDFCFHNFIRNKYLIIIFQKLILFATLFKQTFYKKMSNFFLVTQIEFCDVIDRVDELKFTVTIPVRWTPVLPLIEDDEEDYPAEGYNLEDGEIYESTKIKNSLAAANFMASLVL
jgi:protein gp37